MNYRRFMHGAKFWIWVVLFVAYSAGAVGVVLIDTYEDRYRTLSKIKLTNVKSDADLRRAGATQAAAVYRAQSGMPFNTLPANAAYAAAASVSSRPSGRAARPHCFPCSPKTAFIFSGPSEPKRASSSLTVAASRNSAKLICRCSQP